MPQVIFQDMKKRFHIHPVAAGLLLILATNCVRGPRMDILQYSSEQETASEAGCPLTHRLGKTTILPFCIFFSFGMVLIRAS